MARGPAVPLKGIWLRREGDYAVVDVEKEDGKSYEAIREYIGPIDSTFSHNISEHGLAGLTRPSTIG